MRHRLRYLLIFTLLCTLLLPSCGKKTTLDTIAPFTQAVWDSTLEHICSFEGEEYEQTVSVYGGYSYIFPKTYLDTKGSIQYMFDGDEKLVGVAWFYIGNNQETAEDIYDSLNTETTQLFGKTDSNDDSTLYTSKKWTVDGRSILLVNFSQNDEYAVQISYISEEVNK